MCLFSIWYIDCMEYLSGTVERITFENEENGFCVIKIKTRGFPGLVTVVGNLASVNIGSVVQLTGEWKIDSKFGKQFAVSAYRERFPATVAGIEKYLGSGLIKGIGPKFARRIVEKFKEDTLRVIEEEPDGLINIEGIGPKRAEMIKKAWEDQKEIKNVMLFLQGNGVSTAYAVKIFKTYGNKSIEIVKTNPYRLADDIWGIGFKTADKIAQQAGFDKSSFERCRSGLIYVLNEFSNEGHCYAAKEQLISEAIKILELDWAVLETTLFKIIGEKRVIEDGEAIYLPPYYYSEVGTAKRIINIAAQPGFFQRKDIDKTIRDIEANYNIQYDSVQREAIKAAVASKFMVLTGGPGTGKTTTTLAIIKAFQALGAKVLLAAPTGRAAKRMSETTGMESRTIHRLLEYKPPEGYKRNPDNALKCDALIIDEASMIDIILMYNLLKAVPDHAAVILVGDVDQLPSVGAGNVLKDIINSGAINIVRLTRIFRQAQGSAIITNAHKINKGEYPGIKGGRDSDFFFIEEDEPQKIAESILNLCSNRLPEYYKIDPVNDIQVLCPMQRGETGAVNLNSLLQNALNPQNVKIRYGGIEYRLRDKVMQIKNNYDKNVFNGDIGIIKEIDIEDRKVLIDYEGNIVEYDTTEMDEVVLAYATTVHKSQGSEYKIVVAPLSLQHYVMLQRNLLYTCVTRAKKVLVLVGTKKALGIAVKNDRTQNRNTKLAERLRQSNVIFSDKLKLHDGENKENPS